MNQAVIYARFSPRPMNCPKCRTRMNKLHGLDAYECPSCEHVEELGDGEHGSISTQKSQCRDHCKRRDYIVRDEFHDEALSGANQDRPGLDDAIDSLKRDDVLVVYMLDRLSRGNPEQWFAIENRISTKRARYESVCGEGTWGGNEEDNELVRIVLQAIACHQRKKGNRRTSESMISHQANGRRMTQNDKCQYGFQADPDDPAKLIENPEEKMIIKTIIALYCDVTSGPHRGKGYREVARRLAEAGVKARNGGAITHTLVADLVRRNSKSSLPSS